MAVLIKFGNRHLNVFGTVSQAAQVDTLKQVEQILEIANWG
jgi:hypothetical protein